MIKDTVINFKIGDRVVHPQHGVGKIVKVEDRAFGSGVTRKYYEVTIERAGSTLWVPLDPPSYGLRKLATKQEIKQCRKVLSSRPEPLTDDARSRQSNLVDRLKEGNLRVQCEVVRDLYGFGEHKSLYGTIANFFRQTQDVLCEEWAIVEKVTLAEAVQEVNSLLDKSRKAMKKSEE